MGSLSVKPSDDRYLLKPGLHTHNVRRGLRKTEFAHRVLSIAQAVLFLFGVAALGYYGYSLADEHIYQVYENWAFDQEMAGHRVTFADYLREKTPLGFLVGEAAAKPLVSAPASSAVQPQFSAAPQPVRGAVLGRLRIARLNLSAIVREGIDEATLSRAVGHIPTTAFPGQPGNFAIAAHRDTLFRALKDIKKGDQASFQSPAGTYSYQVVSTKIVRPTDISVLQPEGNQKLLTMITCYPFYYVGSAPKRFIVQAKLVGVEPGDKDSAPLQDGRSHNIGPPSNVSTIQRAPGELKSGEKQISARELRRTRGSSHFRSSPSHRVLVSERVTSSKSRKKYGLRLFHSYKVNNTE